MTARLFVAVVPPPEVIADLSTFVEPRRSVESVLRWSAEEAWHLTLAFMARVPEANYEELAERLEVAAAKRSPFQLQVDGAGAFPNPARAKVLWAGISGDTGELGRLSTGSRNAANTAGVEVDGAQFRPHLTLARLNRPIDITKWLRIFDGYAGSPWAVSEIELIESRPGQGTGGGSRYQTREVFPLGG
jgi:RNA 2',3'-cyclic 3'-phosphodiesterase